MAAGNVWMTTAVFDNTVTAKRESVTWHLVEGSGPPDITHVEPRWTNWWNDDLGGGAGMKSLYPASLSLALVTLRRVAPLSLEIFESAASLPVAGTNAGEAYAPGSAALVSLRTPLRGRSYRGRMYLPAPVEDGIADGVMTAPYAGVILGQMQGFSALWFTGGAPTPQISAVFSRHLTVLPGGPYIATPITQLRVDRRIRSQRRRQDRAGIYVA